jgi:hypothetical protein
MENVGEFDRLDSIKHYFFVKKSFSTLWKALIAKIA